MGNSYLIKRKELVSKTLQKNHRRLPTAKAEFNGEFNNLTAEGKDISDALRNLKDKVKKIIKRYNKV
ncbi:hypothetical protein KKA17_09745 [bacterium]|nr:hypothetical protein [bacterium]MBU1884587.1 hypothetical protein [bacterium]